MTELTAISRLEEESSSQWGMFTTAQAKRLDVSRQHIAQLLKRGKVERISSSVYCFASATSTSSDDIKAAWLSTNPKMFAYERISSKNYDVVVTGSTAACLYGTGDLYASPYTFGVQIRRQSQRPDIRYIKSAWEDTDVALVDGLPTARPEKVIADLVRSHEDPSLISDVAIDFETTGHAIDIEKLAGRLAAVRGSSLTVEDIFHGYKGFPLMISRQKEKEARQSVTDWRLTQQALSQSTDLQQLLKQYTFDLENLPDLSHLHTIGASVEAAVRSYHKTLSNNEAIHRSLMQSVKALESFTERHAHE